MPKAYVYQERVSQERVRRGERPMFAFDIPEGSHVVGIFHYWTTDEQHRETVDHHAVVWVASEDTEGES